MKKFLLAILIVLTGINLNAQNKERNRLFLYQKGSDAVIYNMNKIDSLSFSDTDLTIHNSNGTKGEFVIDNLDSLTFKNVEGRVAADVNLIDHTLTSIKFDITRTASCVGFKLMCLDYNSLLSMGDDDIIYYIDKNISEVYNQDFKNVEIKGLKLDYDTEYAVVTVGIDQYGLLCDVVKSRFATASENLEGNPEIAVEIIENNFYDFTLRFTPNSEVSQYHVLYAEEGTIEYQYAYFSYMEDWNNMGDMIIGWGDKFGSTATRVYTQTSPGTYYEIYIQALDKNGNRAPYEVFKFKTKSLGGEGIANVDIKLGDYVMSEWWLGDDEYVMMPSQYLTFTPNNQTSAYRYNVVKAENYEQDPDEYIEDLCSYPSMQTPGWFQYETLSTDFQIDPGTSCVAIAVAKNINDEWGPVTELYFTTPDNLPGEEEIESITLNVDKETIFANGKDIANFTLTVNDHELTDGFQLFNLEDSIQVDKKFYTSTPGTYTFIAVYDNISSNIVVINAIEENDNNEGEEGNDGEEGEEGEEPGEEPGEEEITSIELVADKKRIRDDGIDSVIFIVRANGKNLTAESVIFNATEGIALEGNTFRSKNIGRYTFTATYNGIQSEEVIITVKETRVYAIGDLYNEDGVIGVVYHLLNKEGTSGYIVSMDEAQLQWSTENIQANCFSGNGQYNTEDMLKLGADKFPAAKWCADHGEGWYMPSSQELGYLWKAVSNGTYVFKEEYADRRAHV